MIELSTKGRYATRILAYLAAQAPGAVIRRQEIAESQGITLDYIEQILVKLKASGFVRSVRGARGGYLLACDPRTTTVAEVLRAVEGPISLVPCEETHCTRAASCLTRPVWHEAAAAMHRVFESYSIADLLNPHPA